MKYEKKSKNTLLKLYGLKKLAPQDEFKLRTVLFFSNWYCIILLLNIITFSLFLVILNWRNNYSWYNVTRYCSKSTNYKNWTNDWYKHVQRVSGMMKAKNALMVLHNMSSLRNPKGFGFLSIIKKYYKYTRQKMKNHPETLLSIRAYSAKI